MRFFEKPTEFVQRDRVTYEKVVFPFIKTLIQIGYFSCEHEGLENVPREGRIIFAINHAGWFTLDALIGNMVLNDVFGFDSMPYAIAHDTLLSFPGLKQVFGKLGCLPLSFIRDSSLIPPTIRNIAVFPEGSDGNTKPFWEAYKMRRWRTGFVHLAEKLEANIVPVAIIGGEESLPNVFTTKLFNNLINSSIGIPFTFFPLPTSWKVIIHPPLEHFSKSSSNEHQQVDYDAIAKQAQTVVQRSLDIHTADRPLRKLSKWLSREDCNRAY